MRWKLLVIASLLAAIAGAGAAAGLARLLAVPTEGFISPGVLFALLLLFPLAAITYASIFVYRHTARRRKLQAFLTALLSILLTCATLFTAIRFLSSLADVTSPTQHGQPVRGLSS